MILKVAAVARLEQHWWCLKSVEGFGQNFDRCMAAHEISDGCESSMDE